jgi:ABC-2 type transport system permease protein
VKLNPITYAVHPIRQAVFDHLHGNAAALVRLNPPLTWWGWDVPVTVQLGVVGVTGLVLLAGAIIQFNRAD